MCGISGIILKKDNITEIDIELIIDNLITLQARRGPDASGKYITNTLGLGHNRLSIQDIDKRSNQPFLYKNLVMVFNGEIYNFLELKKFLENNFDEKFKTTADTEVLIKLFFHIGIQKTLNKIKGMFSIALFDKKQNKIYLIRDRLGEKPLFYYYDNEKFIFASMPSPIAKVLHKHENKVFKINYECLNYYLCGGMFHPQFSLFSNINSIGCSEILELNISDMSFTKSRWWIPEFLTSTTSINNIIQDSVKYCELGDRDKMLLFSGGNDSGVISLFTNKCEFLTLMNGEEKYAKNFISEIGKLDQLKFIDHDFIKENLTKINFRQRQIINFSGIISRSSYPVILTCLYLETYYPDVKIIITGNGGDELFYGYPRISKTSNISAQIKDIFCFNQYWVSINEKLKKKNDKCMENVESYLVNLITGSNNLHDTNFSRWFELHTYLLGDLNVDSDIIFMYSSIETRAPYLNHNLIEKCLSIPEKDFFYLNCEEKTDSDYINFTNKSKKPLKEILLSNGISRENIFRKKHGYGLEEKDIIFNSINYNLMKKFQKRNLIKCINIEDSGFNALIAPLEIFFQEFEYLLEI